MKGVTTTTASLLFLAFLQAAMCAANFSTDPAVFFPEINGNLTKIVWAHAVNNQTKLEKALGSEDVMMLEADVVFGTVTGKDTKEPVMAHPPSNTSDLSLEMFLANVTKNSTKGIKLDFKSIEAFKESKPILDRVRSDLKIPLFINADILLGPVNATTGMVEAKSFIEQAKEMPECTLSVGWATRYGEKDKITEGGYTNGQIQAMISVLNEQNVSQPITYPVRAGPASNDIEVIKSLMEKSSNMNNVTLSVWSSEGDKVNAEQLSKLIKDIGVTKVYVDVPQDLMKQLKLASAAASSLKVASITLGAASLFVTAFLSAIL